MSEFQPGDNPTDHSVAEINEYLARPDVDADEKARVYAAEQQDNGGQGRTTVKDPTPVAPDAGGDQGSAGNQTPLSDETVGLGDDEEETKSAYQEQGSKPYWYEETQGPAPEGAEKTYTVVKVARTDV